MHKYGLIGYPLGHSFSPGYFAEKFRREGLDARYDAFPIERIEDFPALLEKHPDLRGINVTIPYKEAIIPCLTALLPDAQSIGAVNCIVFRKGQLIGYNTDWSGFRDSLQPLLLPHHRRALVLGSGGASKAVRYALQQLGISATTVVRTAQPDTVLYADLTSKILEEHTVVINTTPLGMHPAVDEAPPLPYYAIGPQHLLYDLVYNPPQTRFLALGAAHGAQIKNGLEMLELQAKAAWSLWTDLAA